MPDHELPGAGTTRRGMLRGAAGLGAAGAAAAFLTAKSAPADAATDQTAGSHPAPAHDEPLVVYVRDARAGVLDVFTGTEHVQVTDPALAARLARAAR
jgi:hypothetical protein